MAAPEGAGPSGKGLRETEEVSREKLSGVRVCHHRSTETESRPGARRSRERAGRAETPRKGNGTGLGRAGPGKDQRKRERAGQRPRRTRTGTGRAETPRNGNGNGLGRAEPVRHPRQRELM